ncbi:MULTISPECIES: penicillin-binding protein 2 [Protofrankia]|uniref:penicillin-binding protein 2 n=1 Tax=Protofrankia TaxID=2994361 RepID=UPI00068016E4|nr:MULTISPECIES: penicillin-binding protein 2 [Protofrankia]
MDDRIRVRLVVLRVLAVSLLITLGARLWTLQILDGDHYRHLAETNRVREVVTPAIRGQIVDDQGRPLVRNRTSLVISVNRSVTDRQKDSGQAVLERLSGVIGMPVADVRARIQFCSATVKPPCWNGSPYQPVPVAKDVSAQQALAIIEHPDRFPGVSADLQAVREYPQSSLAAHELGYLSPVTQKQLDADGASKGYHQNSLVGVAGLENTYDTDLRGADGVQRLEVDRFGRVAGTASATAPRSGGNLVLSLDIGVQQAVEQTLQKTLDSLGGERARTASGVVLDAKTGRVIAMASLPSYDPSVFVGGVSEADYKALSDQANGIPLLSRAYQGSSAPGSTFKPVSTLTALTNLSASTTKKYDCAPSLQIGTQTFHNFEGSSAGPIALHQALVISCDVIFDQFAYEAWLADGGLRNGRGPYRDPNEYFVRMARALGFGSRTGIDLPGETAGSVVDRAGAKEIWEELKDSYCRRARNGYPEVTDPAKAERFRRYAAEACVDGYLYNGGAAVQFAIGQGQYLSVSPLQLAAAYAAIANGGTLYQPTLAKAVMAPDGRVVRAIEPRVAGRLPVAPDSLAYIRNALHGVTSEGGGTATGVFADWPNDTIPIAGKTGTAEVEGTGDTSWFASFAPANDPQFVVVVTVPDSGTGAEYAAPAVKAIYQSIYGIGRPAALADGRPPSQLPRLERDGTFAADTAAPGAAAAGATASGTAGGAAAGTASAPAAIPGASIPDTTVQDVSVQRIAAVAAGPTPVSGAAVRTAVAPAPAAVTGAVTASVRGPPDVPPSPGAPASAGSG